jgi:hypothetical protein
MGKHVWVVFALSVIGTQVFGATYQVGAGKTYPTIGAVPGLAPGDIVEIYGGTYNEVKRWSNAGTAAAPITIRGIGSPRPIIDATGFTVDGALPNPRAVFQVEASYVVIENLEFVNARNGDNGSGIRVTSFGVTTDHVIIRNCKVDNNDMGIMSDTMDNLLIDSCEVGNNGTSLHAGYTHNFYLGGTKSTIQYCYIHDSLYGQNFKTRGHYTELLYNFIADSQDGEVGLVDDTPTTLANSNAVMIGNVIAAKPRISGYNSGRFIQFGQDSGVAHNGTLFCYNNTFIAGDSRINFLDSNIAGASIVASNNIFFNSTTISTGNGPVSGSNNWMPSGAAVPAGVSNTTFGSDPGFVNAAARDFHLTSTAQCRDIAASARTYLDGNGNSLSGAPTQEYVHPLQFAARSNDGKLDIGAYEYNSGTVNPLPPVITSGPQATPNPATTAQTVTFTATATDPNGGTVSYLWTFGDGASASGSTATHVYAAAGTYSAGIKVTNTAGLSVNAPVSIVVTTTGGGGGTGGGSGGGGGGSGGGGSGGGNGNKKPIKLTKLQGTVNFKTSAHDTLLVSGILPSVAAGFDPNAQTLTLTVGGVSESFTLDEKGHGKANRDTAALKIKLTRDATKKRVFAGGDVPFSVHFVNGSFASLWNLDPNVSALKAALTYSVSLDVGADSYGDDATLTYTAKAHVSGKFAK